MATKPSDPTVAVYARVSKADLKLVDKAAGEQKPFAVSRSMMLATIVREWADARRAQPQESSK